MAVRVFPVEPSSRVQFGSTWGAPRSGGRSHEGADIFAPEGTPVLAVDDGQVRHAHTRLGGMSAFLVLPDGTHYFYAHLSAFEGASPRRVRAGEMIGRVGNTGNAAGTPHHLHFEIHPGGGAAIDPFPELVAAAPSSVSITRSSSSARAAAGGAGAGLLLLLVLYALSKR